MSTPSTDGDRDASAAQEMLETEVAVLREENRRLREDHRRLLRSTYRRSAIGFGVLAALAVAATLVFSAVQDILFAIAAIAAFAGLLTYYLTPERFVAATVGESVYASVAGTGDALIADLGLHNVQIYLPTPPGGVRVFVPQHREYDYPSPDARGSLLVVPENERARGITLRPTGHGLFDAFETTVAGELTAETLPRQLADALVAQFDLVDSATVDSQDAGHVSIAIAGSAYGDVDRFDHPVGSLLATGLAATLNAPVELETTSSDHPDVDALLTCRWKPPGRDTVASDARSQA